MTRDELIAEIVRLIDSDISPSAKIVLSVLHGALLQGTERIFANIAIDFARQSIEAMNDG